MSNEKFRNQYRIPSARAAWHDYNGGYYFVTVCTKEHEHFFGEIVRNIDCCRCRDVARYVSTDACGENTMILSAIGQFLHETLQNATKHYPYAEIPLFIVMPNHWHAIVFIDGDKKSSTNCGCKDVARYVSTFSPYDCFFCLPLRRK